MSEFKSSMDVTLISHSGDDALICDAARVSTGNDIAGYEKSAGLINYLWREGHTSPFEHVSFTFRVGVPLFIARQIMRHRTFSYNEISGRYSKLDPVFWVPDIDRPLHNNGSGAYPDLQHHEDQVGVSNKTLKHIMNISERAQHTYDELIMVGVATEVARVVLPTNMYTYFYMSGNLKNFLDFIDKRIVDNAQEEVKEVALAMGKVLEDKVPLTMKAWKENR